MHTHSTVLRRGIAACFAASMLFGVAACGDDDDTGDEDMNLDDGNLGEDVDGGDDLDLELDEEE